MRNIVLVGLIFGLSIPALAFGQSPNPVVNDTWPRYSPDGSAIAFSSTRTGTRQIYIMGSDGSNVRRIVFDPAVSGQYLGVSWFANGSLLFSTYEKAALSGADNGLAAIRFLTSTVTGTKPTILYQGINVDRPAASPSGNTLAFEAEHGAYQSNPSIDIETLELKSLTVRVLTDGHGQYIQAAWSPDGSKVAFACKSDGARDLRICVMDLRDRRSHVISHGPGSHQWPAWAPDSKRLAFFIEQNMGGKLDCNIAVINIDGSGQRLLTNHAYVGRDETPSWAPDGKHIAFQTDRLGAGLRIAVMDDDGNNLRMLTR